LSSINSTYQLTEKSCKIFPVDGVRVFITFEEIAIHSFDQGVSQHIDMNIEYFSPISYRVDMNRHPCVVLTVSSGSV
jgi:hypothetical protein